MRLLGNEVNFVKSENVAKKFAYNQSKLRALQSMKVSKCTQK
jgi:hypothetical protein